MSKFLGYFLFFAFLLTANNAMAQSRASISGKLSQFDQQIGSGIWDYGSCLGNDSGLPPIPGSHGYISAVGSKVVLVQGLKTFQKVVHYQNDECDSGRGYTVVRSPGETRNCAAATYNHFCKGAPSKMVIKTGVWDYGSCAGGDRGLCPGLGLSAKNGQSVRYKTNKCASGVARCTVESKGFGKTSCEIARYIHTCE